MPSILDNAVLIGKETTYGTPAALTRAYEVQEDAFQRETAYLESVGFRAGMQALRSDRSVPINMGAAGSLKMDWMDAGMGLILDGLLGATAGPTVLSGPAYGQTHTTNTDGPSNSWTVQVQRVDAAGVVRPFTYHGCVPTAFGIEQSVGGFLSMSVDMDAEDEDTSTAAGSPTYPATASPWNWSQAVVSINGAPTDCLDFSLSAELAMKTDRRFLRGSALKKRPRRAAVPNIEGSVNVELDGLTLYDLHRAGTIVPITVTWTGTNITAGHNREVVLTLPACQLRGETPKAALEDMTTQAVPFKVLHNGTNPQMTISTKSTDAAL